MSNPFEEVASSIPRNKVKKVLSSTKKHCDKCGRNYEHIIFEDESEFKLGCDCKMIAEGKRQREQFAKLQRKRKVNQVFNKSLINEKTKNARLNNYEPTNENLAKAHKIAKRYVEKFDLNEPRSLYLHGTFGTGKSHLAYAIAHEIKEKGFTVLYMNVAQMMSAIRSSYDKNTDYNELDIKRMIQDVDLMVFDDLGVTSSKHSDENLFEILDARIGKHTIYTTNLTASEFSADKKGQRIFSRIAGDSYMIDMNGDDYRLRGYKNA